MCLYYSLLHINTKFTKSSSKTNLIEKKNKNIEMKMRRCFKTWKINCQTIYSYNEMLWRILYAVWQTGLYTFCQENKMTISKIKRSSCNSVNPFHHLVKEDNIGFQQHYRPGSAGQML